MTDVQERRRGQGGRRPRRDADEQDRERDEEQERQDRLLRQAEKRLRLHNEVFDALLDQVREARYPSTEHLDLLEQHLIGDERQALAEVLLDKIRQDRYPSITMIRRVLRLSS